MSNKSLNIAYDRYLTKTVLAALEAGQAIQDIYQAGFTVDYKDDHSPLTQADRASHEIIVNHLTETDIPILSEEGKKIPYDDRKNWHTLWVVDPLDGTKEFIKRNGEFTVNIALVDDKIPVMGIVYAPERQLLYFAVQELGAYQISGTEKLEDVYKSLQDGEPSLDSLMNLAQGLPIAADEKKPYTIVGSRSHATPELEEFVAKKRKIHGEADFIPAGSSLKICLVAEGRADIYPRLGPTMEWDTAAGQAIASISGANVYQYESGKPLTYNKENLLNPWFIVEGSKG